MSNATFPEWLDVRPEVAAALRDGAHVVALESTLIAHGLPWPDNLETAQAAESAIRAEGAVPATIAVLEGRPKVGLGEPQLEFLANGSDIAKASRRDLAAILAQKRDAATTVSATMFLAGVAGIRHFATGAIGGVHRGAGTSFDVSADLTELARTAVAVVCAGAKSILDIPATLEHLETLAVPVIGYRTDLFPAFYLQRSGQPVSARVDLPQEAARLIRTHWALGGAGLVLAQPLEESDALDPDAFAKWLAQAEADAVAAGVHGPGLTPFLLKRLVELSGGKTLQANQALVVANARLAAQLGVQLQGNEVHSHGP
jgi:pseudouridine-5'-phosphate glycosidase